MGVPSVLPSVQLTTIVVHIVDYFPTYMLTLRGNVVIYSFSDRVIFIIIKHEVLTIVTLSTGR